MKKTLKAVSIILSLILFVQVLLPGAAAEDITENIPIEAQESPQILEEDISKRGEYEKHFLLNDGSYLAVSYAYPVHRLSPDGSFEEVDNTLSLKDGRLENADKEFKVSFAGESEKDLVKISHDGYTMSWGLSSFVEKKAEPADDAVPPAPQNEIDEKKTELATEPEEAMKTETSEEASEETTVTELVDAVDETAELVREIAEIVPTTSKPPETEATDVDPIVGGRETEPAVTATASDDLAVSRVFESARTSRTAVVFDKAEELAQLTEEQRQTAVPKISSALVYADVLGNGINARYSVNPGRVKEDIILNAPSDFIGYAMDIAVEGLTAVKAENNSVEFLNGDGKAVFVIQTPYMYDAADDTSYGINVEIEETAEGYRIVFAPDAEWLNAEERVYPVVIDPTVTSSRVLSNAYDTYIYDGGGNPGGLGDRMYVGIKSVNSVYKVHRSYWRVLTLPNLGRSFSITDASFIAQHPSGTSTSRPFSLYGVNGYWTENTITWTNKPLNDTLLVSNVNRNNLTVTFSGSAVTQRVRDWYSGAKANDGFMISYTSEALANPDYNSFWTCDGSTASYVPYISITYSVPTQTWTRWKDLENYMGGLAENNQVPQGFAVGTTYCYSFDVNSAATSSPNTVHNLYRYNMDTDALSLMTVTPGKSRPSLGHANDVALASHPDASGVTQSYMYVVANNGVSKLQYSGNTYHEVQWYGIGAFSGISRMGYVSTNNNGVIDAVQFLLKQSGSTTVFKTVTIPYTGSAKPVASAFSISVPATYANYGSQSIHYEPEIDKLYVLMWGSSQGANKNVILVYSNIKSNLATYVSPPIEVSNVTSGNIKFEIEGIGFPRGRTIASENNVLWFQTYEWNYVPSPNGTGLKSGIYTESRAIK